MDLGMLLVADCFHLDCDCAVSVGTLVCRKTTVELGSGVPRMTKCLMQFTRQAAVLYADCAQGSANALAPQAPLF